MNIRRITCCAFAVYSVAVIALSGRPDGAIPKQAARAWHEYGIACARNGNFETAKTMFECAREVGEPHGGLWMKSTVLLAVTCERLGRLDEANYYFAIESAKHSMVANEARNQFPGAWRNVRLIAQNQEI